MPAHLVLDLGGEARAPVHHRQEHAAEGEPGVQPRLDQIDGLDELRQPLERVVLGLDRNQQAVGGGERIDGQRAERRRAVEEDERESIGAGSERLA